MSAFPEVKQVLLKQREEVPTLETIRMAAIFAGLTVHAGTEEAEETFGIMTACPPLTRTACGPYSRRAFPMSTKSAIDAISNFRERRA